MYFKQADIQAVKKYITERSAKLNVVIGARDEAGFNKVINSILKQKKYYEGEQIDPKHMTELKSNVNIAIGNLGDYLIKNADTLKPVMRLSNPVEYLTTAVDALFITAMEKLGCPNMPLFHFDPNIKQTITQSAMAIHRAFVKYDFSGEVVFNQQRDKDAAEVSKEFGRHIEGINNGKKAESVGKMIVEYQALKDRRKNQNVFWRFFHRTENMDRNSLIETMGKAIKDQLPKGMDAINLDEANPALVSRNIADALIRGEVEGAGPQRLDRKTILKLYGCAPSDEHIPDQEKSIDEYSHKISLGRDEKFLNDVMGADNVNVNQAPKGKVFIHPGLVKD